MWFFNPMYLAVLLVGAITLVYLFLRNRSLFWSKKGVPFREPHWIFGNFRDVTKAKISMPEKTQQIYHEFKNDRLCGVWGLFLSPMLFFTDPALIRDILVKDFGTWPNRGADAEMEVDPLSAHLVNLNGKKWKSVRAKLTPTFTSGKLKQMHDLLLECGKDFEKHLYALAASGGLVEAREMSAKFTTDVIGSCAFGIQMNSLGDEDAQFRKMGRKIFESSLKSRVLRLLQANCTSIFKFLKLSIHEKDVTEFFLKITKETLDYRDANNIQRNDFIDIMRSLRSKGEPLDEDEVEFDDKLIAAQSYVFFAAGFETSSTVISYCLHELAVNQDIQNRLREEVHKTKAANNSEISWDGLKHMKYLDMVVQETLRKYPPIPMVGRTSVKPYRVPDTDVVIPPGTTCAIPIYAIHHDPEYYPEPEKFIPERFTEEAKNQRPPSTFIPFGGGPRVCIGLRFAEQQTKMALVKLVDNFTISLTEKSQNPLKIDRKARFLFPEGGIWIRVSKNSST